MVGRYYFQILPWVLYFAAVADRRRRRARCCAARESGGCAAVVAAVPLLFLVGVHPPCCRATSATAQDFNRGGRQQIGPTDPDVAPIFDAVEQLHRARRRRSPSSGPAR